MRRSDLWGSGSTGLLIHTAPRQAIPGGPKALAAQTRKASRAHIETLAVCSPGPGALLAEGERLEVLSAYLYVLTFLFMGPFFSLLLLFLLCTPLWCFSVLYLVWLFLDRDTPHQGGRRSEWIRKWTVWKHLRDYYPIRLVETVELAPDPNYGLVSHPRGIMIIGTFCNFSTESTGFSRQFHGLRPSTTALF